MPRLCCPIGADLKQPDVALAPGGETPGPDAHSCHGPSAANAEATGTPGGKSRRVARFNERALTRWEWSFAMAEKDLKDLYHHTLKDIYFAEKKILAALPKMACAIRSVEGGLRKA
jgi:hypothetical protein